MLLLKYWNSFRGNSRNYSVENIHISSVKIFFSVGIGRDIRDSVIIRHTLHTNSRYFPDLWRVAVIHLYKVNLGTYQMYIFSSNTLFRHEIDQCSARVDFKKLDPANAFHLLAYVTHGPHLTYNGVIYVVEVMASE